MKDRFLDEVFEYITNYFEESLAEPKDRDPVQEDQFEPVYGCHIR